MPNLPLNKALAAAIEAAQAAGRLMRRNLASVKKVNSESSHDIKLDLDVRCQKLIERQLHAAFPQVAFLGEEEVAGSESDADADFRWVVDPIDGTVNFAHGLPHASVSIALQRKVSSFGLRVSGSRRKQLETQNPKHETLIGVILDPFMGELWTAVRGGPARMNGRVIHVSRTRKLAECMVSIGFAKNRASLENALPYFLWLARRVRKIRMLGSAALGLTYVATGRLDAYVERGVNLWDIAAGGLILERAGGTFWTEPIPGKYRVRMIASNRALRGRLPVPR